MTMKAMYQAECSMSFPLLWSIDHPFRRYHLECLSWVEEAYGVDFSGYEEFGVLNDETLEWLYDFWRAFEELAA